MSRGGRDFFLPRRALDRRDCRKWFLHTRLRQSRKWNNFRQLAARNVDAGNPCREQRLKKRRNSMARNCLGILFGDEAPLVRLPSGTAYSWSAGWERARGWGQFLPSPLPGEGPGVRAYHAVKRSFPCSSALRSLLPAHGQPSPMVFNGGVLPANMPRDAEIPGKSRNCRERGTVGFSCEVR